MFRVGRTGEPRTVWAARSNMSTMITFDFTVDEAVELHLESVRSTSEGSSWRHREQRMFVVTCTVVMAAVLVLANQQQPLLVKSLLVATAAVISLALAIPFGWYYDHLVRSRTRKFLVERLGGQSPYPCSIEALPEVLSVEQNGVQLSFPWTEVKSVHDGVAGIKITFRSGNVMVPNRGFASTQDRAAFLRTIQQQLRPDSTTGTTLTLT
jgi:hypothetical protein